MYFDAQVAIINFANRLMMIHKKAVLYERLFYNSMRLFIY